MQLLHPLKKCCDQEKLFSPGQNGNYCNGQNNTTNQNSTLHIGFVQISVEFFHTQTFLVKKWEGAVLLTLELYREGIWLQM